MEKELKNLNEAAVCAVAQRVARGLFSGAFVALYGDLGAGKTTFTRALAGELGIHDVQSPTFTIVREHEGALPLFHFDAYRLADADELYAIGFEDYLARGGAIVMEWCENVPEALPKERLEIHISGSGMEERALRLKATGERYARILEGL